MNLFGTWRTANVNDLAVDDRPFRVLGKFLLHHRALLLRLGEVRVNRGPMPFAYLSGRAALTTKKQVLLPNLNLNR